MHAYLRSVWECRYFWLSLVRMDLRSRYRGSVLGMGWSLVNPISMSAILCVVFCTIFRQDPLAFAVYLFAGLTVWNFVNEVTQQGCLSFFHAEGYIRQYPAPMAIYPLRTALGNGFHFVMALVPVLLLSAWSNGPLPVLRSLVLGALPGMVLLFAFGWSVAVLVGVAFVHFRDTRHITDIVMRVLFYATPVLYPPHVLAGRRFGAVMQANPLVPFLRLVRDSLLNNELPPLSVYAGACLIAAAACGAAAAALRNEERRLIFHL